MRLSIHNLGSIASTKIDIAPLTVFVGPNNTNKTWTAYALYGLIQSIAQPWRTGPLGLDPFEAAQFDAPFKDNITRTLNQVVAYLNSGTSDTTSVDVKRDILIRGVGFPFQTQFNYAALQSLLALKSPLPSDTIATLEVHENDLPRVDDAMIMHVTKLPQGVELGVQYSRNGQATTGYPTAARGSDIPSLANIISQLLRRLAFGAWGTVLTLPAERISTTSMYFRSFMFQPPGVQGPIHSGPVIDFGLYLDRTQYFFQPGRPESARVQKSPLAALLEQHILGGRVGFTGDTTPRSLEFQLANSQSSLRIHSASSIVKSLGALDLYLSGACGEGDLVVIDEPEMNAHPAAQMAISELLALMVNSGIKVIITTHSPYIVDHLKNLVEASQVSSQSHRESIGRRLKLGTEKAFLTPDKLAVYLFSGGEVTEIFNRQTRTLDWATFSATSDEVANLYSDILEAEPTQ